MDARASGFARILPWPNPILALDGAGAVVAFMSPVHPGGDDAGKQALRAREDVQAILYEDVPVRFWDEHVGPREPHLFVVELGEPPGGPDPGRRRRARRDVVRPRAGRVAARRRGPPAR